MSSTDTYDDNVKTHNLIWDGERFTLKHSGSAHNTSDGLIRIMWFTVAADTRMLNLRPYSWL